MIMHRISRMKAGQSLSAGLVTVTLALASLSCVTTDERSQGLKKAPAPHIERLVPPVTLAGTGFQVQPSGDSAISVLGSDFVSSSQISFNGDTANTTFGGSTGLTALVPAALYSQPGTVEITVRNGDGGVSNTVLFQVLPPAGPAPRISGLRPDSCVMGQGFNLQPSGDSALAVEGADFLPGATIFFGESPLNTTFASQSALTAAVPATLLKTARTAKVQVRNPDGKSSDPRIFEVAPRPR